MKKIISIFLSIIMVATMLPYGLISTFASTGQKATIYVESTNALPSSTVQVDLTIKNNPGILGAVLSINYDEGLTLTNATSGDAFSALSMTKPGKYQSPCQFSWDGIELSQSDIKDGTILSLTFKVADNLPAGTTCNISASYKAGNIIDSDLNPVELAFSNGAITVINYTPGDVNNDSNINMTDVILIRRYIVGGYGANINEKAADVNADGNINMTDVILIRRYIVGGYGVVLNPAGEQHTHDLESVSAKKATCIANGNIAYWHCKTCNKYYSDANCFNNISLDDTVVAMTGHTPVVDVAVAPTYTQSGLTEGSHCSVCNTILVAQTVVPKLQKSEYSITYNITDNDLYLETVEIENPNPTAYSSEDGLRLQNLKTKGYVFEGWYDGEGANAELVKTIPAGTKCNVELYAKWTVISYNISFDSDLIPVTGEKYTVNDEHVLPNPSLDGYIFAGWSDDSGKVIKKISTGNIGNKTYTANWVSERNQAWAKKDVGDPIIYEDEASKTILFAYDIGEIRNVPLYVIHDFGKINSDGVTKTVTKTFSTQVSDSEMKKYTNTVQNATTNSFAWTLSNEWTDSTTISEAWCKENGLTVEEANTVCKNQESNWYISDGSSGYDTTETLGSADEYSLKTKTKNTKTYDVSEDTDVKKVAATVNVSKQTPLTTIGGSISGSLEKSNTDKTGTEKDEGGNNQTGAIKHTGENKVHNDTWNHDESYGGSSSVSESTTVATALSEKISQEYEYGKTYINSQSQSSNQGLQYENSNSDEYSSSVTYSTITGKEETVTFTTSNTKSGYHRWIMAGTAHVFAVIGYDIKTSSYFTYTYTVMDDEMHEFEDYSYSYASYNDNQDTVIPFEIPIDIVDYVGNRVCASEGLEVSKDGIITGYTGADTSVVLPEYMLVDNQDSTKSVITIKGISENAFKGNNKIKQLLISDYVTEIPDNAFQNCTSLEDIGATSIDYIGDNAFSGCTKFKEFIIGNSVKHLGKNLMPGLESLKVTASNASVVSAAVNSGAKEITIGISDGCNDFKDMELNVPYSVESFTLNGYGRSFTNIRLNSNAKNTVVHRISINSTGKTPIQISSPNVTLNEVNVVSSGTALALTSENANVSIRGTNSFDSTTGNTVLAKNIAATRLVDGYFSEINITGNLLMCGSVSSGASFIKTTGNIIKISETDFNNYLAGVINIKFNANGGSVSTSAKQAYYGMAIGDLPNPTRDYYTFDGWYTQASGGEKVTSSSKFSTSNDITLYAHWTINPTSGWVKKSEMPSNAAVVDTKYSYTLRSYTTSNSSSMSGWTKYDTKRTSWGATQGPVYSNPSNGSRNVWSEQYTTDQVDHFNYWRYAANEYGGYSSPTWQSSKPNAFYYTSATELTPISDSSSVQGYKYWYSSSNYMVVYKCGTGDNTGGQYKTYKTATRWYYQEPVYTYYFYKDESKESTTNPSGQSNVSNVQEWVQYRAK